MIKLENIPETPGCYIYKDKEGKIIYVGKAKNLKKRVTSYFSNKDVTPKTQALLNNIENVEFIATSNEVESLILENRLIKKNQPKYNINLRDSKTYAYIELSNEEYPRLLIARKKISDRKYYGPFTSAQERDSVLKILKRTFKIRTCKKIPKKECLKYHINTCIGPCINDCASEYENNINAVKQVLRGRTSELIKKLKNEMNESSTKHEYEKSAIIRDKIKALEYLNEQQNIERNKTRDEDVINYAIKNDKVYLILFNIYKGTLDKKNEYVFEQDNEFLEEFLIQYYSENPVPNEIIIPNEIDASIKKYLEMHKGSQVTITIPKQGEKKQLLELTSKNIEISFFNNENKLEETRDKLKLPETPSVTECFDISHLSGTSMTGSMIQFRNGKPDKNNYRRFKIKTVDGIDDYAAIKEIVTRRYARLKKEKMQYPNLIVIDGGEGQMHSAMQALKELEIKIPIIALAKEYEEIHTPYGIVRLDKKEKALQYIQEVRDEAHRFALKYNKLLRSKKVKE